MAYNAQILTSIYGRRLGLQALSSGQSGQAGRQEYLVGPDAFRVKHSTAESTGTNIDPFGVSVLTTAQSSGVYTLAPPVPGVTKRVVFNTTGTNPIYLRASTDASITFISSQGSTMCCLVSSQTVNAAVDLVPISTAAWFITGSISSAFLRASTST